jgi:uracil-DNA glycosylase
LTDVDVVILGHEPGTPKADRDREDATTKSFADVRGTEFEAVPDGAESLETASALFQTVTKHFSAYWTQAKKCNEISGSVPEADRQNTEAFDRCVGTDGYQGYLRDELRAVIPLYVLTLGKKAHEALHSVFQIESLGEKNFTHAIATGDNVAGLRTLAVENEQFVQVPLGHPSFGIGAKTKAVLGLEEKNGVSPTKQYYQLAGEGLVKLHQQRSEA